MPWGNGGAGRSGKDIQEYSAMRRKGLLFCLLFLIVVGGFWIGKGPFSHHAISGSSSSVGKSGLFKMSGVVKEVDFTHSDSPLLVLTMEDDSERVLLVSKEAPFTSEGKPIPMGGLRAGDVVDVDFEFDVKIEQPVVRKLSVIIPSAGESAVHEKQLLEDPEFE